MARLAVRGTFSPTGPRRPASARRLIRTLGVGSYVTRAIAATSTKARSRKRTGTCAARLGSNHKTICKWPHCILEKPRAEATPFGSAHILISSFRSGHILWLVAQGHFAPPCSARRACMCAARVRGSPVPPPLSKPRFGCVRGTQADKVVERKFQGCQLPQNTKSPRCGHTDA